MRKFAYLLILILIIIAAVFTVNSRKKEAIKKKLQPKLVVGIVVDQMRYDYLYRYWDQYSEDGFKKLVKKGFSCEDQHFSYSPTKTGPGHASVFAGTTPSVHGIIANDWWQKDKKKMTYCVEDQNERTIGLDDPLEKRSPRNLLVTNLSDEIKLFNSYKGKVIGISMKDRGSILPAGKLADAAYWFNGKEGGKFITSSYYMEALPDWVKRFNDSGLVSNILKEGWKPLYDIESYWQSNEDDSPYEEGIFGEGTQRTFPYDLSSFVKEDNDVTIIKESAFMDVLVNEFALMAIEEEALGKDEYCDMLTISYSAPDNIGHTFGSRSIEIQDTYLRLDLLLSELLKELDDKVGKGNYLLFLTADHAAAIVPQELIDHKVNIDYLDRIALEQWLRSEMAAKYGVDNCIENITNHQIFFDELVLQNNHIDKEEAEEFLTDKIMEFDGIYMSASATSMRDGSFIDNRLLLQKGYNQKLSGNVLYEIYPGWKRYIRKTGTTHGTTYNYDNQVPLLFYGWKIPHGSTHRRTLVEDIAPTITSLLHTQQPMGSTGNPIWELWEED